MQPFVALLREVIGRIHMNSLLINAGLPQLRCTVAGGHYVYEKKVTHPDSADNYPPRWVPVDFREARECCNRFNELGRGKSL